MHKAAKTLKAINQDDIEKPAFEFRQTLNDHVQQNMQIAHREYLHQRIIFVAKHKESTERQDKKLKESLTQIFDTFNENLEQEKITGLALIYNSHSVHMLEGPEEYLNSILKLIINATTDLFRTTKIVLVYSNSNQRFFPNVLYKLADAPVLIDKIADRTFKNIELQTRTLIKKMINICTILKSEDNEDLSFLGSDYTKLLPAADLIEFILTIDHLLSLENYNEVFGTIPDYYHYDEQVWTVPYDFIPDNVYDWGEYDINFTFGKRVAKATN